MTPIPSVHSNDIVGCKEELAIFSIFLAEKKVVVLGNDKEGKVTTLVAAYVAQEYEKYRNIAWICQNSDDIVDDIIRNADLLRSVGLHGFDGERNEVFDAVLHSLRSIKGTPKLLVVENVSANLQSYRGKLPSQPSWHLIIISREKIKYPDASNLGFLIPGDAVWSYQKALTRTIKDGEFPGISEFVTYQSWTYEVLRIPASRHLPPS